MLWFWFIHFSFVDVLSLLLLLLLYCFRSCDLGSPGGIKSGTLVLFSLSDEEPACSKCHTLCESSPWGRRYHQQYQLSFFKISAKDTKNTMLILVTQISVIHQSKMLSVYFYLCTLTITTKLCAFGKKENKQGTLSVFSISANCF